jgi:hypothetical protein
VSHSSNHPVHVGLLCRYGGAGAVSNTFAGNGGDCSDTLKLSHLLARPHILATSTVVTSQQLSHFPHHPVFLLCRYGGAGAVWDIFSRDDANCSDTKQLSHWLAGNASSFMHQGEPVEAGSFTAAEADCHAPIMSQQFMLNAEHRAQLRRDTGDGGCHLGLMVCCYDLSALFWCFGGGYVHALLGTCGDWFIHCC